jgi:hypothetical protein
MRKHSCLHRNRPLLLVFIQVPKMYCPACGRGLYFDPGVASRVRACAL